MKLLLDALFKYLLGVALVGAMLFLPAWTLSYPHAWLFLGLLFLPTLVLGIVLFCKSPDLLRRRLQSKEKQAAQRGVVALSGLLFPAGFVLSALDFRFGWSHTPTWLVAVASVLFLLGYGMYAEVMRENVYLSRTIEVQEGQALISTGLYGMVRHPMYLATLFLFLPLPLVLGSLWGLLPFGFYPVLIVIRILDEERVLTRELAGYADYKKQVQYRLLPFIW